MQQRQESFRRVVETRKRFYPALSRAISVADETYDRKLVTEAQLKALSVCTTGGDQWGCTSCGEHKKAIAIIAAFLETTDASVQKGLKFRRPEGGKDQAKIRFMPELREAVDGLIANGHLDASKRILGMSGVGLWSFPLIHVLPHMNGWMTSEMIDEFILRPELQAVFVAGKIDLLLEEAGGNFKLAANAWAKYLFLPDPANFAFRADGIVGRLLADGHTMEL